MQAIALVTGDELLLEYNLTIETEDVLGYLRKLHLYFIRDGFFNHVNFDNYYGIDFAFVVGPSGFCYNFNMIDADELFNLNL